MGSLFKGLDAFGMDDIDKSNLFDEEKEKKAEQVKKKAMTEADLLYDRTILCPVCGTSFQAKTVRQSVARSSGIGVNLRPLYSNIDPIKYDVVHCEVCGYSALNRNFKKISDKQVQRVREKISMKFVGKKYPEIYEYDTALERYKLALYNDMVMNRDDVNKAFLCLKASWISESLVENCQDDARLQDYKDTYKSFVENAYSGFTKSYKVTSFPVFGMNQLTYQYLLGVLAYESDDIKSTGYWLGKVLLSKGGNDRLKDKARELKERIDADKKA